MCDPAESCTGSSGACPADAKSTAVCRAAAGSCDVAETCDGIADACPADTLHPSGFVCRPGANDCDVAESCSGLAPACPSDDLLPDGSSCSDGTECTTGDTCTAGVCDGEPLVCDPCQEVCDPLVGCTAADCQPALAGKSQLTLKRGSVPAKDSLGWKWTSSGEVLLADFGTPTAGSSPIRDSRPVLRAGKTSRTGVRMRVL